MCIKSHVLYTVDGVVVVMAAVDTIECQLFIGKVILWWHGWTLVRLS